jgi:hypothetical protein
MSDEICQCACHYPGKNDITLMHMVACCRICPKCHIRIVNDRFKSHVCDPDWAKFADHMAKAMPFGKESA